jgi:hypothetical protein
LQDVLSGEPVLPPGLYSVHGGLSVDSKEWPWGYVSLEVVAP